MKIKKSTLIHLWMKKKISNYPNIIISDNSFQDKFIREYIEKCLAEYYSISSFTNRDKTFKGE